MDVEDWGNVREVEPGGKSNGDVSLDCWLFGGGSWEEPFNCGKDCAAVCGAAYLCNSSCIAATARADPTVDMAGEQQFTETGGVRDWAVCAELPALEVVLVWNANTGRDCEMAGEFVETG